MGKGYSAHWTGKEEAAYEDVEKGEGHGEDEGNILHTTKGERERGP